MFDKRDKATLLLQLGAINLETYLFLCLFLFVLCFCFQLCFLSQLWRKVPRCLHIFSPYKWFRDNAKSLKLHSDKSLIEKSSAHNLY